MEAIFFRPKFVIYVTQHNGKFQQKSARANGWPRNKCHIYSYCFVSKQTNAIAQIAIDLSALPYIDLPSSDRRPYPLKTSFPTAVPKSGLW